MDKHDTTWCELADGRTLKTLRAQDLCLPKRTGWTSQMRGKYGSLRAQPFLFHFLDIYVHISKNIFSKSSFFTIFTFSESRFFMFSKTPISLLQRHCSQLLQKESEGFNNPSFNNTTTANGKLSWSGTLEL